MAEPHVPTPVSNASVAGQPSSFSGKTIQLIGWRLLGVLLSIVTLGIAAPWAHCMILRWETKHTYINGKRLYFDGKGGQLFGKSLLWGLLLIVTFGVYGLFLPVRVHKWRVSHTRFAREDDDLSGPSGGKIAIMIVAGVLAAAVLIGAVLLFFTLRPATSPDAPTAQSSFLGGIFQKLQDKDINIFPSGADKQPAKDEAIAIAGTWYYFEMSSGGNWLAQPKTYIFNPDGTYGLSTQDSGYTYSPELGITSVSSGDHYTEGTYVISGKTLVLNNGQRLQLRFDGDILYIDGQAYYQGDPRDIALDMFTH